MFGVSAPTVYTMVAPNNRLMRMAAYSFIRAASQNTGIDRKRNPAKVAA